MTCSALNLSPCLMGLEAWWASIAAWTPWVIFAAICLFLLTVAALISYVTKSNVMGALFLGLVFGLVEYFRGKRGQPFNPVPPLPGDPPKPTPKPPVRKPTIFGR